MGNFALGMLSVFSSNFNHTVIWSTSVGKFHQLEESHDAEMKRLRRLATEKFGHRWDSRILLIDV